MNSENRNEIIKQLGDSNLKLSDFNDVTSLTDEYRDYSENIQSKKIDLGFEKLTKLLRGLRTQELMTIISKTGVGKSALILNFMINFVKKTNELSVLFSCEMSSIGIAERIFQIELDHFGKHIEENFITKNDNFIKQCYNLKKSLKNFVIITKRIDVNSIPDYIKIIELMKNKKVRLIGIDYLGLLNNKMFTKDEYLRNTDNMIKLYSYAKTLDAAIINLSQTSRADIKSGESLTLYSGKSTGEVENSSDFVLSLETVKDNGETNEIWNVINPVNEKYRDKHKSRNNDNKLKFNLYDLMKLSVHKNRRGQTGCTYVTFNRKNLRIKEYVEKEFEDENKETLF